MDCDSHQSALASIKFLFPIVITDEDGRTSDFPQSRTNRCSHVSPYLWSLIEAIDNYGRRTQ